MLDTAYDKSIRFSFGVCFIGAHLNQRIVPPIANEDRLEADVLGAGNGFGVLTFDVFVENRTVVSAIALWEKKLCQQSGNGFLQRTTRTCGKMKGFSRILREGPHESLQSGPESGRCG